MIRRIEKHETDTLISLAASTSAFKPGEAEELLGGVLNEFFEGGLGDGHEMVARLADDDQTIAGWSYFAPSFHAEGVWDVWWIGVVPSFNGKGHGKALIDHIESEISKKGGRVIVIETSSTAGLDRARGFYPRCGYEQRGVVPDFYGKGDDKIIFSKSLNQSQ